MGRLSGHTHTWPRTRVLPPCTVSGRSRTTLNDLETTPVSTSSGTLPVSTCVQAFHGAAESRDRSRDEIMVGDAVWEGALQVDLDGCLPATSSLATDELPHVVDRLGLANIVPWSPAAGSRGAEPAPAVTEEASPCSASGSPRGLPAPRSCGPTAARYGRPGVSWCRLAFSTKYAVHMVANVPPSPVSGSCRKTTVPASVAIPPR